MLNAIAKPFGILLLWLNNLIGNYGVAIFLFALVVKLILLPFQMKSKKSMMRMSALSPQVAELQKRHEGNPRKLQEETSKLYKEEHVNPMSGCLWSLIPFPILIALYQAIRYPLTVMMGVPAALLAEGGAVLNKLNEMGFTSTMNAAYIQLNQSQFISENFEAFSGLSDKLVDINYRFLGLNLGEMPQWNFFSKCDWSDTASWLPALGLFLIPVISAVLSWLQTKISQSTTATAPAGNEQSANSMKTMNLMMPLISLYIGFVMPAALGLYWIFNSLLALVQELILNKVYGKQIAAESAAREEKRRLREAEWEQRRQETERLRAEGKTQENENTSRKKQLARQKAEQDELKAAAIREERAKRGQGAVREIPASQVGTRRYARGRAYVEDRFTNPEDAAQATEAAAEESESWSAEEAAIAAELGETAETAAESEETAEIAAEEPAADDAPADEDASDEAGAYEPDEASDEDEE